MKETTIDEMTAYCKRKGFVFSSGEIYGGLAGFWDFGPLGVELKNNIKRDWWNYHVHIRNDIVGMDGSIITHPRTWDASGHISSFVDTAVVCVKCKNKAKVDKHELKNSKCEKCGGSLKEVGEFNPMFTTFVGPVKEESVQSFLRPETAQLIFTNFKQITDTTRLKLPFGIAQIGKAFRNEIAPRNFLFRCREFEQMEIEYFIDPKNKEDCQFEIPDIEILVYSREMQEKNKEPKIMKIKEALSKNLIKLSWHAYFLALELDWFRSLGVNMNNFRIRQHLKDEKAHYATDTWDIEYNFPFGYKELEGIADRGVFDLTEHQKASKKSFEIMNAEENKKVIPMVISEPSLGVERAFLVFLFDAYSRNKEDIILKLSAKLSPIKAAVFPLVKKDKELVKKAKQIYDELKEEVYTIYDESGSVGRRYARNDEIGTPFCIVTDSETLKDDTVTIRNRDDAKQKRVKIKDIREIIRQLVNNKLKFSEL